MYSNMLASLIEHRKIQTTERRARDLRRIAERTVTRATALGDLLLKDRSKLEQEDKSRIVHAMRMVHRRLRSRDAVIQLFEDVAPRYLGRPGGYTRITKLGNRKGDGAPMAQLEFIEAELPEREGAPKRAAAEKKRRFGLFGRKKVKKS
jgi:large subunit ribosomal protein L17